MKILYQVGIRAIFMLTLCVSATENASSTAANKIAQPPALCSEDITLTSQAQVDAFPATFGCTEMTGSLTISGKDITNLDSLHSLTKVGGNLRIGSNPNLSDLTGLSSLTYAGAGAGAYPGVHITYNPKLINLGGLSKLTSIRGMLEISNNDMLANLDALYSLASIGNPPPSCQSLIISNNPALSSLKGLRSITSLPGVLQLENNASLPDLDGLNSLTKISGDNGFLFIKGNASLISLDGLSALTTVSGRGAWVNISNNPSLVNLNGLSSLTRISGGPGATLEIRNNVSLTNLNGLSSLSSISAGKAYLKVIDNPNLTACCALYRILHSSEMLAVTLSGNGSGSTREDITNSCRPSGQDCDWNIYLTSQSEVNAFPSIYHCPQVNGTLKISGNDITNIDSLYGLTMVRYLVIWNNGSLTNLNGLKSLHRIEGDLVIAANARLTSLEGLNKLTFVKGSLGISNATLTDLEDLSALDSVGSLEIIGNPALTSLKGLRSLTVVSGGLEISGNPSLLDLEGLESVTELGRSGMGVYLTITNNKSLANIDGLRAVTFVDHGIIITDNPALKNLNGLSSLTRIGSGQYGSLEIARNSSLTHIDGLSSLTSMGGDSYLLLNGNLSLSRCCGLYGLLHNDGVRNITISGNGAACTRDDIIAGGPCPASCLHGGQLPLDKYVVAEQPKGYAPHSTNVIVRDHEPGILYEVLKNSDNSHVAGPLQGNNGLYVGDVMETTAYHVLARNPNTGCVNRMSTRLLVTILPKRDSVDCASVPVMDRESRAERESVTSGEATNIIVLDGEEGVEYMLRNNDGGAPVAGPSPGTVGLNTGELYKTTTFNVLAIDQKTQCSREMNMKIIVTVVEPQNTTAGVIANRQITNEGEKAVTDQNVSLYPNPSHGEFDLEIEDNFFGLYYLKVRDFSGRAVIERTLWKEGKSLRARIDLKPNPRGIYVLSVYRTNGLVTNEKVFIED